METPKYYEFMNPILQALRERGGTLTNEELVDAVVTLMRLPDEILERRQQGHNLSEVEYRIAWAKSYLKQAGYLTQSERGVWALTPKGKETPRINERAIVTAVRKAYVARRKGKFLPPTIQDLKEESVQDTSAAEEIEEELSWKQQALDAILAMPPEAFERLSQRLLRESGFTQVEVADTKQFILRSSEIRQPLCIPLCPRSAHSNR
jgi:restriction system protein